MLVVWFRFALFSADRRLRGFKDGSMLLHCVSRVGRFNQGRYLFALDWLMMADG